MVPKRTIRVLLVEDNPEDVEILWLLLDEYKRADFEVVSVPSIRSCKEELKRSTFDVVLLDYWLPGDNGLALLRSLDGNVCLPPVIMLSGQSDVVVARDAILFGAYNYLVKDSLQSKTLGETIRETLEKARLEGLNDRHNDDLQKLAFVDPLTGLYNRRYLDHALEKECARAKRYGTQLSCLMIDLDDFKSHNDNYGHVEGDALMRQVAALIRSSSRDTDVATRYGGDEFCILLPETPRDGAMQLAERLRYGIATMQLVVGRQSVSVTASIGVLTPEDRTQLRPDTILDHADAGLRKAKMSGKNQVCEHVSPSYATPAKRPGFGR